MISFNAKERTSKPCSCKRACAATLLLTLLAHIIAKRKSDILGDQNEEIYSLHK